MTETGIAIFCHDEFSNYLHSGFSRFGLFLRLRKHLVMLFTDFGIDLFFQLVP